MADLTNAVSAAYFKRRELSEQQTQVAQPPVRVVDIVRRIRAEYEEMPDLCLTAPQAARFFGVDGTLCPPILAAFVAAGFLRERNGRFVKASRMT